MSCFVRLIVILSALIWPIGARAQPASRVVVSLHAASTEPAAGRTTMLAIRLKPEAGWHGYWSNPGDSGLPPTAKWTVPAGVRVGALQHPAPTTLRVAGMTSFVHGGEHVLLAPMAVPAGVESGTALPVRLDLDFLICSDTLCVPQKATTTLNLVVGAGRADASTREMFAGATRALPAKGPATGTFSISGSDVRLIVPAPVRIAGSKAVFFPVGEGVFDLRSTRPLKDGGIEIAGSMRVAGERLSGIVSDGQRSVTMSFERSAAPADTADATGNAAPAASQTAAISEGNVTAIQPKVIVDDGGTLALQHAGLLLPILGAMIGGLLLNLMPCVFPILSLKAMHLVRSGSSPSRARRDGLGYATGVITACLALGAVVIGLREAGVSAGWSFQLQNPYVIIGLLLLVVSIALNLAGLFDVSAPSFGPSPAAKEVGGSFGTGALAAVIATPCSAPFMASALGAALVLPPLQALLVFAALGLGLSLPFLLLALVPALQSRLPRPGRWMVTLQRVLSIPMFLTGLGLTWVLGRQVGIDALMLALVAVLTVGLLLWWTGYRQRKARPRVWLPLVPAAALSALTIMFIPAVTSTAATPSHKRATEPFSEARLAELRQAGTPVFVDFTADWCLTCKVNEKAVIEREATMAAFARNGVVTLVGDWTSGDPAITAFLAKNGRNSIPFYLYYAPGEGARVLPQLLTVRNLVDLTTMDQSARSAQPRA